MPRASPSAPSEAVSFAVWVALAPAGRRLDEHVGRAPGLRWYRRHLGLPLRRSCRHSRRRRRACRSARRPRRSVSPVQTWDRSSADISRGHHRRARAASCFGARAGLGARAHLNPRPRGRGSAAIPIGRRARSRGRSYPAFSEGRSFPDRARETVSGCVRRLTGGLVSVKPCSRPSGPFTYHSLSAPRRYSTRLLLALGWAGATGDSRLP